MQKKNWENRKNSLSQTDIRNSQICQHAKERGLFANCKDAVCFNFNTKKIHCVLECGRGRYSEFIGPYIFSRECRICPKGTYTESATDTECTKCPDGLSTLSKGATRHADCRSSKISYISVFPFFPLLNLSIELSRIYIWHSKFCLAV